MIQTYVFAASWVHFDKNKGLLRHKEVGMFRKEILFLLTF